MNGYIVLLIIILLTIMLYNIKYLKYLMMSKTIKKKEKDIYRINEHPCTQNTKRCYYPYATKKGNTSYLCCKNHLIELLNYLVEVFDKNDVIYFLDYGTLLGCVRNNSFIPWDTDIDISLVWEDDSKLDKIMDIIGNNDRNYYLVKEANDFYRLNFSNKNTLHVDIMIRKKNKNNYYYDKYVKYNWIIHEDDLFPLETDNFENIIVRIPRNPHEYLEDVYGKGCISNPKTRGNNEPWERW